MSGPRDLHGRARALIPGGVSSPARAFTAVGGDPVFALRGEGAYLHDVEGNVYVDYIQGFGAIILGHADSRVTGAVSAAASRGAAFGLSVPEESILAASIVRAVPSIERLRFVASGTEASMTAARIARAATGRRLIVKFEGCYHGHADAFLAEAGSGIATFAVPGAEGVTAPAVADTIVAPFNDSDAFRAAMDVRGDEIAAVFIEPVPANMGVLLPDADFLLTVLKGARESGVVVVFDEIVTGFRLQQAGAQGAFGLEPDLTLLGKVIGGGLPVGAVGGRAELLDQLAPEGAVYQAGTFAAHPHAMAAGCAVLDALSPGDFVALEDTARSLADGLAEAARTVEIAACVVRAGTILSVFFTDASPRNFTDVRQASAGAFARFHRALRERGVLIPPSAYEAWFPSLAHGEREIELTLEAARHAFAAAAQTEGS